MKSLFVLSILLQAATSPEGAKIDQEIQEFTKARDETKMKVEIVSRNADRMMTQNWVEYRHEIAREESLQNDLQALDTKIAELEKQKADLLAK